MQRLIKVVLIAVDVLLWWIGIFIASSIAVFMLCAVIERFVNPDLNIFPYMIDACTVISFFAALRGALLGKFPGSYVIFNEKRDGRLCRFEIQDYSG